MIERIQLVGLVRRRSEAQQVGSRTADERAGDAQ